MYRDVYSGRWKLDGKEHESTIRAANNYAAILVQLQRFDEAKSVLRKAVPVARRVLGEEHLLTLKMRKGYARALYEDNGATLDDLREAVTTLEDTERISRRVFGGAHPMTGAIGGELQKARVVLRDRRNAELRAAVKDDPSSLSADDRARAEQLKASPREHLSK